MFFLFHRCDDHLTRNHQLGRQAGACPTKTVGVTGFVVLPKRWIVERTFAWLGRYRRHTRDHERTTESSEAVTHIAMINLMSKQLARPQY